MYFYLGADLSYTNEIEDRGGVYFEDGVSRDPFRILKDHGANIARVRLWHTPTWTAYSTLDDVIRTLRRVKALGMAVLLDFHYSDTWADPAKQIIPAAWKQLDLAALERAAYDYTCDVLLRLKQSDLTPDFVQVGNEINTEILRGEGESGYPINWERNARLINAGIEAVRATATSITTMLHIAQPENILPWFDAAFAAGIADFDLIGMSYYSKWSTCSPEQAGETIRAARDRYGKPVMIVETAYPWTLELGRAESHLLSADALLPTYPATPRGQRDFLLDLTRITAANGGVGVVYWEPTWISTPQLPSIWENSALFDYEHQVHEGIEFLSFAMDAGMNESTN